MKCYIEITRLGDWAEGKAIILGALSIKLRNPDGELREHIKINLPKEKVLEIVAEALESPSGEISVNFPDVKLIV